MSRLPLLALVLLAACGPVHHARVVCDDAPKAIRHVATECQALHVATRARRLSPAAHKAAFHESVRLAARAVLDADSLHWHAHADTLRTQIGLLRSRFDQSDTPQTATTSNLTSATPPPPPSR